MMLVQLRELKIRTLGPFLILLTCQRFSDHTPLPSYLRLFFFHHPLSSVYSCEKLGSKQQNLYITNEHLEMACMFHWRKPGIFSQLFHQIVYLAVPWAQILSISWGTFFNLQLLVLLNNYVQKINAASCDDHCAPFTWCVVSTKLLKWDKISHGMQESLFFTSCRPSTPLNPASQEKTQGLTTGLVVPGWHRSWLDFSYEEAGKALIP